MLPFAPSADRNKAPILDALRPLLEKHSRVLEIGSGTGQHAVHFTTALPHVLWQCSELPDAVDGLAARLAAEGNERTPPPLALDVAHAPWPIPAWTAPNAFDVIFTSNTLHIMSFDHVRHFFTRAGEVLAGRADCFAFTAR